MSLKYGDIPQDGRSLTVGQIQGVISQEKVFLAALEGIAKRTPDTTGRVHLTREECLALIIGAEEGSKARRRTAVSTGNGEKDAETGKPAPAGTRFTVTTSAQVEEYYRLAAEGRKTLGLSETVLGPVGARTGANRLHKLLVQGGETRKARGESRKANHEALLNEAKRLQRLILAGQTARDDAMRAGKVTKTQQAAIDAAKEAGALLLSLMDRL